MIFNAWKSLSDGLSLCSANRVVVQSHHPGPDCLRELESLALWLKELTLMDFCAPSRCKTHDFTVFYITAPCSGFSCIFELSHFCRTFCVTIIGTFFISHDKQGFKIHNFGWMETARFCCHRKSNLGWLPCPISGCCTHWNFAGVILAVGVGRGRNYCLIWNFFYFFTLDHGLRTSNQPLLIFSPHHFIDHASIALDDFHDFIRHVFIHIVRHRNAQITIPVHLDRHIHSLQMNAFCVVSDSGTLPEESSFFTSVGHPFPAVCIRTSTERPEALDKGDFTLDHGSRDRKSVV